MLKWLFGSIFVVLAWAAVFLLGAPAWAAVAVTAVTLAVLVGLFAWRRLRAARGARHIEAAFGQASGAPAGANPLEQGEIRAMQAEFEKALGALKGSKLARQGKDALAVLPWYLIIGPPGAGKSTAIRASGLQFPYLSGRRGGVRGVGGTRNCEWWLTKDAILLDTAGRYTTEDEDRDEWLAFLDLLRKSRPKRPVNGILVAVSVSDLAETDEERLAEMAEKLRGRIDEVMSRLDLVLPIYVLVTKCDLLPGFVETFDDLGKAERGQTFGFTAPLGELAPPGELLAEPFAELVRTAEQKALARLADERSLEARARILTFPQQLASLRDQLAQLLDQVFFENPYQETPLFRGLYFTSGTQQGTPIDRVLGKVLGAFGGLGAARGLEAPATEARSFFLRDLLLEVVFPDRDVAFRNRGTMRRAMLGRIGIAAAIGLLALAGLGLGVRSYLANLALAREAAAQLDERRAAEEDALPRLQRLARRLDELERHAAAGPPLSLRFGMYQGDRLLPATREAFMAAAREALFEPLARTESDGLEGFVRRQQAGRKPNARDGAWALEGLRSYLVVTRPAAAGEPAADERTRRLLAARLAKARAAEGLPKSDDALLEVVTLYLRVATAHPALAVARDEELVRQGRALLADASAPAAALDRLLADPAWEALKLDLPRLVGYGVTRLEAGRTIHGAFTRKGYESRMKDRLAQAGADEDAWVLGGTLDRDAREQRRAALAAEYFRRYADEWKRFFEAVRVRPPADAQDALAALQELTDSRPHAVLLKELGRNTRLEGLYGEAKARAAGLLEKTGKRVRETLGIEEGALPGDPPPRGEPGRDEPFDAEALSRTFAELAAFATPPPKSGDDEGTRKPVPIDLYQEQLELVRDDLKAYLEDGGTDQGGKDQGGNDNAGKDGGPVEARIKAARKVVENLVRGQPTTWRPRLLALLVPPLDDTLGAVKGVGGSNTNAKWCTDVQQPFGKAFAKKYPFVAAATDDVPLATFTEFFAPAQGRIWQYFERELAGRVRRDDVLFELKERDGVLKPALLVFLSRAAAVTRAAFPAGAASPVARFSIQIQGTAGVAETIVDLDGQKVSYRNGPLEWKPLTWPGGGGRPGASIKLRGAGLNEELAGEGEWGLFRLLDRARLEAGASPSGFVAAWKLQSRAGEVKIAFKPVQRSNPFVGEESPASPALFHPFRARDLFPPRTIAKGQECSP